MIPAFIEVLKEIPLTPNGKIDRKALPLPSMETRNVRIGEAPRTETEKTIAAIWIELMRVDAMGIHDDFFDVGGHSMTATALVGRLRTAFGVDIGLASLFERPTIAGLSEIVDTFVLTSGGTRAAAGSAQREEFEL